MSQPLPPSCSERLPGGAAGAASSVVGVGLFSGRPGAVALGPGQGIAFVRDGVVIPADVDRVVNDPGLLGLPPETPLRNTMLAAPTRSEGFAVGTVEHVMSALAGLGRWGARVVVEGPEVPIMDGSAMPFVGAVERLPTADAVPWIDLPGPVRVERGESWIEATPRDKGSGQGEGQGCSWEYVLWLPVGKGVEQRAVWDGTAGAFVREIAPARTFSLEAEARQARAAGLFGHVTPRDMLVLDGEGRAIENELRFADEPARHKLLDLIGDLALLGGPLRADIRACRSGHALAHEFCRAVRRSLGANAQSG